MTDRGYNRVDDRRDARPYSETSRSRPADAPSHRDARTYRDDDVRDRSRDRRDVPRRSRSPEDRGWPLSIDVVIGC